MPSTILAIKLKQTDLTITIWVRIKISKFKKYKDYK